MWDDENYLILIATLSYLLRKSLNYSLIVHQVVHDILYTKHLSRKDQNCEKSIWDVIYDREVVAHSVATRGVLAYRNAATDHKRRL